MATCWGAKPTSSMPTGRTGFARSSCCRPRSTPPPARALAAEGADRAAAALAARSLQPPMNPRLAARLAAADLIVYAPGTQHSSLFPSYLTAGLSDAIAANTRAVKLLITNIQADAEIAGSSAVDIIERAVFYLKDKGRRLTPTPALVTHYLLNAPQSRRCRRHLRAAGSPRRVAGPASGPRRAVRAARIGQARRRQGAWAVCRVAARAAAPAAARGDPSARRRVDRQARSDAARDGSRRAGRSARGRHGLLRDRPSRSTAGSSRACRVRSPRSPRLTIRPKIDGFARRWSKAASNTSCSSSRRACTTAKTCPG